MLPRKTAVTFTAAAVAASLGLFASTGTADDDRKGLSVGASFGRGLNTAQPGNAVNHAILPMEIKVKVGGVVNFAVAGFHDIIIFKKGFKREDLDPYIPATGTFIFPRDPAVAITGALQPIANEVYYRGINPAGGPPVAPAPGGNPSNVSNRSEPVSFSEPGTYLVICNVLPHLLDGMFAYVNVSGDD